MPQERAMVIKSCAVLRFVALISLLTAFAAPPVAQAQQPAMIVVTILTGDKGMVDARSVATKDIVAQVTAQRGSRTGMHIVTIRTCPGVPPDTIQAMLKDLEARKFMVAIDLKDADPRLCKR